MSRPLDGGEPPVMVGTATNPGPLSSLTFLRFILSSPWLPTGLGNTSGPASSTRAGTGVKDSALCWASVTSAHDRWSVEHSIHVHNLDSGVDAGVPVTLEGGPVTVPPPGATVSSGASGSPPGGDSETGAAFSALTRSFSDFSTRREM